MAPSISGQQSKNRQGQRVKQSSTIASVTAKFVTKCLATHFMWVPYCGESLVIEARVSIYAQTKQ